MPRAPRRSSGAEIGDLLARARDGQFGPAQVIVGPERFLSERAVSALRRAALGDGPAGFNDDVFHGSSSLSAAKVIGAARTLPMMARARFVLVRDVDKCAPAELEAFASYLGEPSESTCLVLTADKLHGQSKLAKAAKKAKVLYDAKPLKGPTLRRFVAEEAARRGHKLSAPAGEALLEAIGDDLAALDDALERLSLFVGEGQRIEVDAVEACVSRIATDSIWTLVDAVGMRDTKKALVATGSLLAAREPPLRILAMVARQLRIVARMRDALSDGLSGRDAAAAAGAPPFKARELTTAAKRFAPRQLAAAFATLAETDLALKGSKRPPERVLEEAVLRLCASEPRARERIQRRQRTYR